MPKHVAVITNNESIFMHDGRKYEIFLEIQQHNGMIFTKKAGLYFTTEYKCT
jgi:hypothetical protein